MSFWDDAVNAVASVFGAGSSAVEKTGVVGLAQPLTEWESEHSQAIVTAVAGAAGFVVGGPAGTALFTSVVSAAYEVGGAYQKGTLSAATMLDAGGKIVANGNFEIDADVASELNIDKSQLEGLEGDIDAATGQLSAYGVSLPTVEDLVKKGKVKIIDEAGALIGGDPHAPFAITFVRAHITNIYASAAASGIDPTIRTSYANEALWNAVRPHIQTAYGSRGADALYDELTGKTPPPVDDTASASGMAQAPGLPAPVVAAGVVAAGWLLYKLAKERVLR